MPKDKTESHSRIEEVMKKEFLEKGFEKTSMREIGRKVGLSQAALYRHYKNKEAMFSSLVDPFIKKVTVLANNHESDAYTNFDLSHNPNEMVKDNLVSVFKKLIRENHDELRLLICCSRGTKYEEFIHEIINLETKGTYDAINYIREKGIKVNDISLDEVHVLLTAYVSAILEPIYHDWPLDKAISCLDKVEEFFIPGWLKIMGF